MSKQIARANTTIAATGQSRVKNAAVTQSGGVVGRPFVKGNSGRPKGAKNKASREIKAYVQELFERPKHQAMLKRHWDAGTLDPTIWRLLLHYAFGKPATTVSTDSGGSLLDLLRMLPPLKKPDAHL